MGFFTKSRIDLTSQQMCELEVIAVNYMSEKPPNPPRHLSSTESAELTKLSNEVTEWISKYLDSIPENSTEVAPSMIQTSQAFFQPQLETDSSTKNQAPSKPSINGGSIG